MSRDREDANFVQQGGDKTRFGKDYRARPTPDEIAAGVPGTEAFRAKPPLTQHAVDALTGADIATAYEVPDKAED